MFTAPMSKTELLQKKQNIPDYLQVFFFQNSTACSCSQASSTALIVLRDI